LRRILLLLALAAGLLLVWMKWRDRPPAQAAAPIVTKQPVTFASHSFNPAQPSPDMPHLQPGEEAECDANFNSRASVAGQLTPIDGTHATVTITQVRMTLGLQIDIWAPVAATQHVIDHEEGHRQIAEKYYEAADKVAARVGARHLGQKITISGANLDSEMNAALQKVSFEMTDEYNRELDSGAAQARFDSITDHARNDVPASTAITQALSSNPPS
jgi:hypothetical protein